MKKGKFIKEKTFYVVVTIVVFLISFVSISYAFTDNSVIKNVNSKESIPRLKFNKLDSFEIKSGNLDTKDINVVLTSGKYYDSTCTFDVYYYYNINEDFITSENDSIFIDVLDGKDEVLTFEVPSQNKVKELITNMKITAPKEKTVTKNLHFKINASLPDDTSYHGKIALENVICLNDK